MSVAPGTRLGAYEVVALIGAGGMGEVYRAYDTKLNRDVALKVLPDLFARDPDRLARFKREAQLLASINHPHIAAIYGFEDADGVHALVLELVEGPTLAERIARPRKDHGGGRSSDRPTPIPLEEALSIARQIAEALEGAHEHGIVHRDLKPANIKVRADGAVKVLDFGLAKAVESDPGYADLSQSPTLTSPAVTGAGVILGTAPYMAPEQATGTAADARCDIWAFGVVLYEMLTGRSGFGGATTIEVLSNVLKTDPDWTMLPAATPPAVRSLLRRCLQKDRTRRLRDIADARFQIEEALNEPAASAVATAPAPGRNTRERLLWMAGMLAVAVAAAGIARYTGGRQVQAGEIRLDINAPPTTDPTSLAISPDGRQVVFVATSDGKSRLWLRALDGESARSLPGTEGATLPFWSPDSHAVGFSANGQLKRVDVGDGTVRTLARGGARSGTWSKNGRILFTPGPDVPLSEISAEGGEATQLGERKNLTNWFPQFLPDDRHFLFYGTGEAAGIYVGELGSRDSPRRIIGDVQAATYSPSGHLFFVRQGTLFAQAFDSIRLTLSGSPITVAGGIVVGKSPGLAALSVSAAGPIVYRTGRSGVLSDLVWFDRSGKELEKVPGSAAAGRTSLALSRNSRRVAYEQVVSGDTTSDIWLLDLGRGVPIRFTSDVEYDIYPVWSPDDRRLAFTSRRRGTWDLYLKRTDGTRDDELLLGTDEQEVSVGDWSPDGRLFLFGFAGKPGMAAVPVEGDRKPFPVSRGTSSFTEGKFSPDGKWIAYESDESGRREIYVQRFPGPGGKTRVSRDGGTQALWRRDGKELFYLAPDNRITAVTIRLDTTAESADVGTPEPLFAPQLPTPGGGWQYAVSPDGQRFLVDALQEVTLPITVVLNWKPKP